MIRRWRVQSGKLDCVVTASTFQAAVSQALTNVPKPIRLDDLISGIRGLERATFPTRDVLARLGCTPVYPKFKGTGIILR